MATVEDFPVIRSRNQAYIRAQEVLKAIRSLRHGGTVYDVRSALIDLTGMKASVSSVRASLWHLRDIGVVEEETVKNSRWWKAVNGS